MSQAAAILAAASIHVRHHHTPTYTTVSSDRASTQLLMLYCHLSVCPSICLSHAKMSHLTTRCILSRLSATTFVFPTQLTPYMSSICPSICLLRCILHPCCVSTEKIHTLNRQLCTFIRSFYLLISYINLLFYVSGRLLCLIFACRPLFLHLILHIKTSFSCQICTSTPPLPSMVCFNIFHYPSANTYFIYHLSSPPPSAKMTRYIIWNWSSLFDDSAPTTVWPSLLLLSARLPLMLQLHSAHKFYSRLRTTTYGYLYGCLPTDR